MSLKMQNHPSNYVHSFHNLIIRSCNNIAFIYGAEARTVKATNLILLLTSQLGPKTGEANGERLEGRERLPIIHCEGVVAYLPEL